MKKSKPKISIFNFLIMIVTFGVFLYVLLFSPNLPTKSVEIKVEEPEITENTVLGEKVENVASTINDTPKPTIPAPPQVTALSYVVYDANQDKTIAEHNSELILPPASTTKLMTALVALEEYSINDILPIPKDCLKLPGTQAYLSEGDFLSVESLLYALLLPSASDAACVLARGYNNPSDFLAKMNKKSEELGLKHTNFDNVIGLDGDNGTHFSTASDLLILAKAALKNQELMKIVGTKYYDVHSYATDKTYTVRNTNELLFSLPGTVGLKTGTTEKAGACLIYVYANTNKDKKVIIIVMGSKEDARFSDTKALLDWYLEW
ncbi:MAG: D-alanyl-D-alanine carboxypeptidase [bacterium]